jgi:plasmid rolling circle replication initiator protein Rep
MKKEILQDIKNGKKRPWREKKMRGLKLAESMHRLGMHKKANRVWWCSSTLAFLRNLETNEIVFNGAQFCRERLCPTCQWRKSLKIFHQVSTVMDVTQERQPELVPVFLTLTLRNCIGEELSGTLDMMFQGWYQITKHSKINRIVKGWFRALEVTYNKQADTFHPHIHAILLVDKSYFKKENKDYMHTTDWVKMWRTALKLDYDPSCDIRKVKKGKNGQKHKAVAEVATYTLKEADFLFDDNNELTDKLVEVLSSSLRNRRLIAVGGILKKIAKELKADQLDPEDLVYVGEETIREDVATVLELYRWNFGASNYEKD